MSDNTEKTSSRKDLVQQCVHLPFLGSLEEMGDITEKLALALGIISFNNVYICRFWGRSDYQLFEKHLAHASFYSSNSKPSKVKGLLGPRDRRGLYKLILFTCKDYWLRIRIADHQCTLGCYGNWPLDAILVAQTQNFSLISFLLLVTSPYEVKIVCHFSLHKVMKSMTEIKSVRNSESV